jgi:hypothetical protein
MNPTISKALERLLHVEIYVELWREENDEFTDDHAPLKFELAALIRDVSKPFYSEGVAWCRACGCRDDTHADDDTDQCALIALCKAINGSGPHE